MSDTYQDLHKLYLQEREARVQAELRIANLESKIISWSATLSSEDIYALPALEKELDAEYKFITRKKYQAVPVNSTPSPS